MQTIDSIGRGGGIRTPDPLLPKQMRYQTALRPDGMYRLYREMGLRLFVAVTASMGWHVLHYGCMSMSSQMTSRTGIAKPGDSACQHETSCHVRNTDSTSSGPRGDPRRRNRLSLARATAIQTLEPIRFDVTIELIDGGYSSAAERLTVAQDVVGSIPTSRPNDYKGLT